MIGSAAISLGLLIRSTRSILILNRRFAISKSRQNVDSIVNSFTERSHHCGQLTQADIGQRVNLFGWVKYTRFDNKIIALRDSYGTVQCIVDRSQLTKNFRQTAIYNESVVRISGTVQARPSKQMSRDQATGDIEVLADQIELVSRAKKDIPILTRESNQELTLVNRLKYRYLDIRGAKLQEALRFRSKLCSILRRELEAFGFVDCETPTLFRRTPGGANEFIVPTQTPNKFYGLTQSPQQLKQLLMIGGLDRYYQICRCYRDESGRTDRQPEFTQLDIEMSFTNQELIMDLINHLLYRLFTELADETNNGLQPHKIFDEPNFIERLPFQEAFSKYGSDKPDTRFGWLIEEIGAEGLSVTIPHAISQDIIDRHIRLVRSEKKIETEFQVISDLSDEATRLSMEGKSKQNRMILGALRVSLASELEKLGRQVYDREFKFLWVTDFPLFTIKEEKEELESNHHPFTSPTKDTIQYLNTDPTKVIGLHYDLVLNGQEVGGGSIRIHDADLQRFVFANILNLSEQTFEYFIEALRSGCPPHGGIAIGLDRLIAILLGRDSIRDVIAFPKSGAGRDLMSESPHEIDADTKKMYNIETIFKSHKVD